ncbi:MAG TPA: DR2241 family protein [Chthoniobacter sp.]|nr:DR2241 family protein [Chthoniobacter sp.]
MMPTLTQALAEWIAGGGREIGEIHLEPGAGGFALSHRGDGARRDLTEYEGAEAARELAHFDADGKFRPLKTAPNLRHGWKLRLASLTELRTALDYFYPAMLGVWLSHRGGRLVAVPLRHTLARQTGMYAITRKITDDQAQTMIAGFCRNDGGCLKRILWQIAPEVPITSLPAEKFQPEAPANTLPLLCQEACNLLVAQAREVVKKGGAAA